MKKQFNSPEIIELDFKDTSYIGAKKRTLFIGSSGPKVMRRDCWNLMNGYFKGIEEDIDDQPETVDVDDNW